MKKTLLSTALLSLVQLSLQADTIHFTNGALVKGKITSQDKTLVTIEVDNKETTYSKSDIKSIDLDKVVSPPPPAPAPAPVKQKQISGTFTIDAGTILHTRTLSQLNTASHSSGHTFIVVLESALVDKNNVIVIPKGTKVYGKVLESKQAGRLFGHSKMLIELQEIEFNDRRIKINTTNIDVVAKSKQGKDTAKKVLRGAAIGGLINGSDGASDGAKVGVGAAILTRGKATGVPQNTLLDFRLESKIDVKI